MSRKLFIAGNWKMNLNCRQAADLAAGVASSLTADCPVEVAVCPPFVYLPAVRDAMDGSPVALGAQNLYPGPNGAFTGEISAEMLCDLGCSYVIIGHSERRHTIKPAEDDTVINSKVLAALKAGLKVILCIGETLEERRRNQTESVLDRQLTLGLANVSPAAAKNLVIAYEPVWAIGTGQTATTTQAQEAHAFVRGRLADLLGQIQAQAIRIQYGGSVKPDNAADLLAQSDVDGALVGGASLKAADFIKIIEAGIINV